MSNVLRVVVGVLVLSGWMRPSIVEAAPGLPARALLQSDPADAIQDTLITAIEAGDVPATERALTAGASVERLDVDGVAPLTKAASIGNLGAVKVILDHGAAVDRPLPDGATALFAAAYGGHLDVVQFLISKRAKADVRTVDGQSPAMVAALRGHLPVLNALIAAGVDPGATDQIGRAHV